MDRKTFLKRTIGALLLAIPAYTILSCSSSDDSTPNNGSSGGGGNGGGGGGGTGNCSVNGGTASSISSNHGHSLTVPAADVNAGVDKTYNIQGSSSHPHTIMVSSSDFATLSMNNSISKTSTNNDGHTHSVTITCA